MTLAGSVFRKTGMSCSTLKGDLEKHISLHLVCIWLTVKPASAKRGHGQVDGLLCHVRVSHDCVKSLLASTPGNGSFVCQGVPSEPVHFKFWHSESTAWHLLVIQNFWGKKGFRC